jgi:hypothetical protein
VEAADKVMRITDTEFLFDRVRVHYNCNRPWGVPDEYAVMEVLYVSLDTLPSPPPLTCGPGEIGEVWEESVYIRTHDATVSFHFAEWEETDDFRMQALIGGPYLGKLETVAEDHIGSEELPRAIPHLAASAVVEQLLEAVGELVTT